MNTWHAGEVALQKTVGADEILAPHAARIFQPELSRQMRDFFPGLPFVALGFLDEQSRPWATLLSGSPGFAWSPHPTQLQIGCPVPDTAPLKIGSPVGILGIELPTRRRNRVNGRISALSDTGFCVAVRQAFGNCPKYIQQRIQATGGILRRPVHREPVASLLDPAARKLILEADTMFVSSFAPDDEGTPSLDISHRGGRAGFMKLQADGSLTIPDFSGNRYFNTLGNILLTGVAGLAIPDFDSGDLLLVTGSASIGLDGKSRDEASRLAGAERLWRFVPAQAFWLRAALPANFELRSWSPHTLATGSWPGTGT